jgi:hypothetical protein
MAITMVLDDHQQIIGLNLSKMMALLKRSFFYDLATMISYLK